jgi:Cu-Zn family superoxide dismutase
MRRILFLILLAIIFGAPDCHAEKAVAHVKPTQADGAVSGDVLFEDTAEGLKVSAQLAGLTPGDHGFHIHQYGVCSDSGKAAGGHYNPEAAPHGLRTKDGAQHAHAGDLGNISIAADGTGNIETMIPGLTLLSGAHAVAGRSVIIHENKDDFSQPLGNAGSRVGCGEIVITP